jgi:hypothetical protein
MIEVPPGPYPYPHPLPPELKQAHMQAIGELNRRLNRWIFLTCFPGFCLAVFPVMAWLRIDETLAPAVALPMMIGGSVLGFIGLVPAVRIFRLRGRHIRLLQSYGVPLNRYGIEFGSAKGP